MAKFREQENIGSRPMSRTESSQFFADLDIAWRSDQEPTGDREILVRAADLDPADAAVVIVSHLREGDGGNLQNRLGNLGVLTGELNKNRAFPGGVVGVWRSDRPVVLMTNEPPRRYDRTQEVAQALGVLTYHEKTGMVKELVGLLQPLLSEIEGSDGSREELPRRRLGLRALIRH